MGRTSQFTINVKLGASGSVLQLSVTSASSIAELKSVASAKEGIKPEAMKIVFGGLELEDSKTVEQCEIQAGASLYLLAKVKQTQIVVKTLKGRSFTINIDGATSVAELKKRVEEQDPEWDIALQRIIFQGRELEDQMLLLQSGLDDANPLVHLVMKLPSSPGATTRRGGRREEAGKGGARGLSRPIKVEDETVAGEEELNEQAYDMLDAARLDLDDTLGDLSSPLAMELDTEWAKDFSEEPALPSPGGWMNSMEATMEEDGSESLDLSTPPSVASPSSPQAAPPIDATLSAPAGGSIPSASAKQQGSPSAKAVPALKIKAESDDLGPAGPSTQGRAYDLTKVDDKLRKRLLKNRLSAERSRQRKQAHVETLEFELSVCRSENDALKKRVATLELQLSQMSLPGGAQSVPLRPQIAVT